MEETNEAHRKISDDLIKNSVNLIKHYNVILISSTKYDNLFL